MNASWSWPAAYCAVVGGQCPHSAPTRDVERSAFIAYPSDPRTADNMRRFAGRQAALGATLTTWEDLPRAGASIIFCDICKALFQASAAIFEITNLNQNVLFEFGYALGRARRCVLLRNTRIKPHRLQLVTDVRYLPYRATDEIVAELSRRDPFEEQSLGEALAAGCPDPGVRAEGCSILYLQTGSKSDASVQVHRALKKMKHAALLTEDPRESFSHQLHELTRRLSGADVVVAALDATDAVGSQERNAQTCILAGMAVALEKRVLVLQEQPADHLIDLRAVLREYRSATEARGIVARLQSVVDEVVKERRRAHREQGPAVDATGRRRGLTAVDFGQAAAEQEAEELSSYFVPTSEFEAARSGRRWLLVGRRGTGKSANCLELAKDLGRSPRNVVSLVCPLEVEVRGVKAALGQHFDDAAQLYVFEAVWTYMIYTEMVKAIAGHMDENPSVWRTPEHQALSQWLEAHPGEIDGELDERLGEALDGAGEGIDATTHWAPGGAKIERLYRERSTDLQRLLESLLAGHTAYLLIDNLDKDWDETDPISAKLLVGLLRATERIMTSSLKGVAKILIFLREDIRRAVASHDDDDEKRPWMDLRWDEPLLLGLVAERIRRSLDLPREMSDIDAWCQCFTRSVGGVPSQDFMFGRTLLRPRHAIWYCNRALDIARRSGHETIGEDDVVRAERDYSDQVLRNVAKEFSHSIFDLDAIALQFCDAGEEMDEVEVKRRIRRWCEETGVESRSMADTVEEAVELLYGAGFLGVVQENGQRYYGHTQASYQRAVAGAKHVLAAGGIGLLPWMRLRLGGGYPAAGSVVYCVHPAFWRSLDIKVRSSGNT